MTAYEYLLILKAHGLLPPSTERRPDRPPYTVPASNSEIKRWLRKRSVQFDRHRPDLNDVVEPPRIAIIFFPKGRPWTLSVSDGLPPFTDAEPTAEAVTEFVLARTERIDAYNRANGERKQRQWAKEHAANKRRWQAQWDAERETPLAKVRAERVALEFELAGSEGKPRPPCVRCGNRRRSGERSCGRCGLCYSRIDWWRPAENKRSAISRQLSVTATTTASIWHPWMLDLPVPLSSHGCVG